MTPHLQATHLVVLMQSSCVFTCILFCCLHLADWTWYRICQFALGCTSLILMVYVRNIVLSYSCRVSLFVNKIHCCPTIIISTILFIIAVILNAYSTALTTQTLLKYVCVLSYVQECLKCMMVMIVQLCSFGYIFVYIYIICSLLRKMNLNCIFIDMKVISHCWWCIYYIQFVIPRR